MRATAVTSVSKFAGAAIFTLSWSTCKERLSNRWSRRLIVTLGIVFLALPPDSFAEDGPQRRLVTPAQTAVAYAKKEIQGFGMKVWLSNQMCFGLQAWDRGSPPLPQDPQFGLQYPLTLPFEHLFGAGVWFGGMVNGFARVTEGYGENSDKYFLPDPNHPLRELIWQTSTTAVGEPNTRGWDDDGDGKIDEDDLDGIDNDGDWSAGLDDIGADGIPDSLESGCKGGYSAGSNPDPSYDNYRPIARDSCHPNPPGSYSTYRLMNDKDLYTERNGIPDHGEPHVDEDYAAVSDRDLTCSATDTVPASGHTPLGIKVIQKSYAWSDTSRKAILPVDYCFINIGQNVIQDPYIAMFVDADIGPVTLSNYYLHNYACYIDSLRTAYTHNAVDSGSTPLGITFIGASKLLDQLSIAFFWNDFSAGPGPGAIDTTRYLLMSGNFPGGPIIPCQSPLSPSDPKMLLSVGPFDQFNPGDTIRISFAFVSGDSLEGAGNTLVENARKAIREYATTGVQQKADEIPLRVSLQQNYPNPFNPSTIISYTLPLQTLVTLKVFNVLGQEVTTLVNGINNPGINSVNFDGSNLSSGIYFYKLQAGSYTEVKKLVLLK